MTHTRSSAGHAVRVGIARRALRGAARRPRKRAHATLRADSGTRSVAECARDAWHGINGAARAGGASWAFPITRRGFKAGILTENAGRAGHTDNGTRSVAECARGALHGINGAARAGGASWAFPITRRGFKAGILTENAGRAGHTDSGTKSVAESAGSARHWKHARVRASCTGRARSVALRVAEPGISAVHARWARQLLRRGRCLRTVVSRGAWAGADLRGKPRRAAISPRVAGRGRTHTGSAKRARHTRYLNT